jgi:PLP dependent protein
VDERRAPTGFDAHEVRARLAAVRERIAARGELEKVTIVAVTKALDVSAARAARDAGLLDLGENYSAELIEKAAALGGEPGPPLRWHLIGGIQRRTLARLARHVALYQSVDRDEEVRAIARHAPGAAVLIEVETTGIQGRGGVAPDKAGELAGVATDAGLFVRGLMTVAAPDDATAARKSFRTVRRLVDALGLSVASMGMSDDFEIAVEEGSTMVRLGRVLFGPRPTETPLSQ